MHEQFQNLQLQGLTNLCLTIHFMVKIISHYNWYN